MLKEYFQLCLVKHYCPNGLLLQERKRSCPFARQLLPVSASGAGKNLPHPPEWSHRGAEMLEDKKKSGITVSYSPLKVMNFNSPELRDDWKAVMRNLATWS